MNLYEHDIGEKSRAGSRFISRVNREIQRAFLTEKSDRKFTQAALAKVLGINRSVVNRQIMGLENMTLRSVAELLWALGWEPHFEVRKAKHVRGRNEYLETNDSADLVERVDTQTRSTARLKSA